MTEDWSADFLECDQPGVDGFSLVAGAVGAFMKMVEPIARMNVKTDGHQKTITLLIISITSIPPLLGFFTFTSGCMNSVRICICHELTPEG